MITSTFQIARNIYMFTFFFAGHVLPYPIHRVIGIAYKYFDHLSHYCWAILCYLSTTAGWSSLHQEQSLFNLFDRWICIINHNVRFSWFYWHKYIISPFCIIKRLPKLLLWYALWSKYLAKNVRRTMKIVHTVSQDVCYK